MEDAERWLNDGLLIPYALAVPLELDPRRRQRIHPEEAQKGLLYYCPECSQALHLFGGSHIQRLHFRHDEYTVRCDFREDGADRVIARHAILDAVMSLVDDRYNPDRAVKLVLHCPACAAMQPGQPLPERVAAVLIKYPVRAQGSGTSRLADVVLVDDQDSELCLIEIHRDREAPQFRFRDFTTIPWVIVRAKPTMADPRALVAKYSGNLEPFTCQSCQSRLPQPMERLDANDEPWGKTWLKNNTDASHQEAIQWAAQVANALPSTILATSTNTDEALIVDIETGRVYKRLRSPIGQVIAHCHYLNKQTRRRVYCVVQAGQVLPPMY